jgi:ABC-type Fe3+ transport system permease subunit
MKSIKPAYLMRLIRQSMRPRYTRFEHHMRKSTLLLAAGIFCTFLLSGAVSVYVFHDVDKDMIGHWDEAFAELFKEGIFFTLLISGATALLTLLGRYLLKLNAYSPHGLLGFFLGIGLTAVQYPCDFVARKVFPNFSDILLVLYMIIAVIFCTVVLLYDTFKQKKYLKAFEASLSVYPPR